MFNYKEWYEKTKAKRQEWNREYYQKHKERIAKVHKTWAKKNVDQGGSIWRKYNHWRRIRDPFLDAKYYDSHREQILTQNRKKYQRERNYYKI